LSGRDRDEPQESEEQSKHGACPRSVRRPSLDAVTETIVQRFESVWGEGDRVFVSEAPYRVSPLGAHTDHQDGLVLGMTTRARLRIVFRRRDDGRIRVRSRDFPGAPEWTIGEPLRPTGDFADYLRGVSSAVAEKGPNGTGCHVWIEGDLRPGGVASSAALAIAWLGALLQLEGRDMNPRDRMRLVVDAERRFAGVEVGLLDPAVILFGGVGKVVYLDCLDGVPKSYAVPKRCPPFEAVLVDSGVVRDLRVSPYNARVEECRSVARALGVSAIVRRSVRSVMRTFVDNARVSIPWLRSAPTTCSPKTSASETDLRASLKEISPPSVR